MNIISLLFGAFGPNTPLLCFSSLLPIKLWRLLAEVVAEREIWLKSQFCVAEEPSAKSYFMMDVFPVPVSPIKQTGIDRFMCCSSK